MLKKNWIWIALGGLLLTVFVLISWNRESTVQGEVTMDGVSIAAGRIKFQSDDSQWTASIENGQYRIRNKKLAGQYSVEIEVHFVNAKDAGEFYQGLTQELNETGRDRKLSSKKLKSLRSFSFNRELSNGSNYENFELASFPIN